MRLIKIKGGNRKALNRVGIKFKTIIMSTPIVVTNEKIAPTLVHLNLSDEQSPAASPIIDYLKNEAATILASALGGMPLVSFQTGTMGNFPYYYTDPNNLKFNNGTYNWINTNLLNNTPPIRQQSGSYFTDLAIQVLSKVTYKLSQADQVTLNKAYTAAQNQQLALLTAWQAAMNGLPPGTGQPIDNVMAIICTTWANPVTNLYGIKNSTNLYALLSNAPASGSTIIPLVAQYVDALVEGISLANAVTMNIAYVSNALAALQSPSATNGGIQTNDGTTKLHPGYTVTTPLPSIINSLQSTSNSIEISMDVSIANSSEYSVSINGGTAFNISFDDFFGVSVGGNASYFHDEIVQNASSVNISMTFTGANLVNYMPNTFDESTLTNWFFIQPILDAIKNKGQDVSGYQFSPDPEIDFTANGPFGILQGVAIAAYPSAIITVKSSNYQSIDTTFNQTINTSVSFLGIPLGGGSETTYQHSASSSSSDSTVTITLNPPPELVGAPNTSSVAWILGVQTNYPTAL
jgi:hypothetical protein